MRRPADGSDRIVFDSQLPGLGLRITPTGTRIFLAQARVGGRKRRVTVGFAADMTLTRARTEALHALVAMRSGRDPVLERKARCAEREHHHRRAGRQVAGGLRQAEAQAAHRLRLRAAAGEAHPAGARPSARRRHQP